MVDTKELFEKLEREALQQRKRKIKRWLMSFKDLFNMIKMVQNSGMDLRKVTLSEVTKMMKK